MSDRVRRWLAVGIVIVLGLLTTAAATVSQQRRNQDELAAAFGAAAAQVNADIATAFNTIQYGLRGARGAVVVAGEDGITRDSFVDYAATRDIETEFQGARGFGFIRRVPGAEEAQFLAEARTDGAPNFTITSLGPNDGDDLYVIQYIEPVAGNEAAVGLDVASEPRRKAAADTAAATGQATITEPITLVQADDKPRQAFLILLPIYRSGAPLNTVAEREAANIGWSYAPIVTSEVLDDIGVDRSGLDYSLAERLPDGRDEVFYTSPGFDAAAQTGLSDTSQIAVFGRTWDVQSRATTEFVQALNLGSPWRTAVIGLVGTALAAALTFAVMLARSRRREAGVQQAELVKSREEALARRRFEFILAGTNAGTWEWNVATGEAHFNERWAEIVGYTLADLEPTSIQTWLDLAHPDDLAVSEDLLARHFAGELDFYDVEARMRHRDGHWVWVHDRGRVATWTDDGKPEWMFGTHMDISTNRELRRQLSESQELLQRSGELARVGGWRLELPENPDDLPDTEVQWTETTRAIHEAPPGFQPSVAGGVSFYTEESIPIISAAVERAVATGEGWDRELQIVTYLGRVVWVRSVGAAERDDSGRITALFGVFQDIDERHRIDAELRRAKAEADQANAAKSSFLANTSHEIRTPMNALIGLTYLLAESDLDPDQRDLVYKIDFAGKSLAAIINDVLDLSKVEAGELVLEHMPVNVGALTAEVVSLMTPQAESRRVDLSCTIAPDTPPLLIGDATRIRQIASNLLSNALKFTEPGGSVNLALTPVGIDDDIARIRLTVVDTGIGMSPEVQERLFTPFMQADSTTSRTFGGTGLGLSIVRHLVELMGGTVGVTSTPGQGSEFHVELPLAIPSDRTGLAATGSLGSVHVLIAEDDDDQRRALGHLARAMGWEADEVASGRAMIEQTMALIDQGRAPDVLLLDWRLADMDALSAMAELADRLASAPPVAILITGHDRAFVAAQPHANLVARVLTKPVDASQLFNAVSDAVARPDTRTTVDLADSGAPTHELSGLRILVVDDSELNLLVARRILQLHGATVEEATGGQEALTALADRAHRVDVLLLDVQMPRIDGYEVARRVRETPDLAGLPIIALTAGALVTERDAALAAGMNAFLTKPLDPRLLVESILSLSEGRAVGAVDASGGHPGVPDSGTDGWPDLPGIDVTSVRDLLGGDSGLFVELLTRLVTENDPDQMAAWAANLQDVDRDVLRSSMHRLRGGAGTLGAHDLAEHAARAERLCRNGDGDEAELAAELAQAAHLLRDIRDHVPTDAAEPITPHPAAKPVTPAGDGLARFAESLRRHNLTALAQVDELSGPLQDLLGERGWQALREAVRALDFSTATALIAHLDVGNGDEQPLG